MGAGEQGSPLPVSQVWTCSSTAGNQVKKQRCLGTNHAHTRVRALTHTHTQVIPVLRAPDGTSAPPLLRVVQPVRSARFGSDAQIEHLIPCVPTIVPRWELAGEGNGESSSAAAPSQSSSHAAAAGGVAASNLSSQAAVAEGGRGAVGGGARPRDSHADPTASTITTTSSSSSSSSSRGRGRGGGSGLGGVGWASCAPRALTVMIDPPAGLLGLGRRRLLVEYLRWVHAMILWVGVGATLSLPTLWFIVEWVCMVIFWSLWSVGACARCVCVSACVCVRVDVSAC
jgi:hypothetical protein